MYDGINSVGFNKTFLISFLLFAISVGPIFSTTTIIAFLIIIK